MPEPCITRNYRVNGTGSQYNTEECTWICGLVWYELGCNGRLSAITLEAVKQQGVIIYFDPNLTVEDFKLQ